MESTDTCYEHQLVEPEAQNVANNSQKEDSGGIGVEDNTGVTTTAPGIQISSPVIEDLTNDQKVYQ